MLAVSGGPTPEGAQRRRTRWDDDQRAMQYQLDRYGAGQHATEIYSPQRVTNWASRMRLAPGLVFDMACSGPEEMSALSDSAVERFHLVQPSEMRPAPSVQLGLV